MERGSDHHEVVDVAPAVRAFGPAESGVGHRAPQNRTDGRELLLGEAYTLYRLGGVEAGGADFYGSSCHNT
ncbi:hypothetical protein [Streptomyces pseudogriseolus]|uniref:hypothetical protein n=1 Tax=Streptomyces pseudogriseolus TaxID=36817 RepID=UPI003FA1DB1B